MWQKGQESREWFPRIGWEAWVGIPLVVYVCIAAALAYRQREYALGDAVCYIRRALYLVRGDWYHSISGYWSPLISWSIAPLMWLGMDGLYAARAVLVIWGAVMVGAFAWLLHGLTRLNDGWKLGAVLAVAVMAAEAAGHFITPDIIVAACLMGYFAMALHPRLKESRGAQFGAGVLGGIAYLGKAYAFPFVLAHLPLTVLIRGWGRGERRRWLGAWGVMMLGWAVIAGPWVGVLSWRYGQVTFSTSGARAHAYVGPERGRSLPEFGPPPDPYIVAWENPETIAHPFWSPLRSRAEAAHQLKVVGDNVATMARAVFWRMDRWHLATAMAAAPVLVMLVRPGWRWRGVWLLLTILLYASGYLLVYFTDRYVWFVLWPLVLLLLLTLAEGLPLAAAGRAALMGMVLASFGLGAWDLIERRLELRSAVAYRRLAEGIRAAGLTGPIAGNHALKCYPVAMHLDEKFLLFPLEDDVDVIERKLREAGARVLLVWGSKRPTYEPASLTPNIHRLVERGTWRRVALEGVGGVEVYVRADEGQKGR